MVGPRLALAGTRTPATPYALIAAATPTGDGSRVYPSPRQTVIAWTARKQIDQFVADVCPAGTGLARPGSDVDVASASPHHQKKKTRFCLPLTGGDALAGFGREDPSNPDHHHRRRASDTGIRPPKKKKKITFGPANLSPPVSLQPGHRHRRPTPSPFHRGSPPIPCSPTRSKTPGRHSSHSIGKPCQREVDATPHASTRKPQNPPTPRAPSDARPPPEPHPAPIPPPSVWHHTHPLDQRRRARHRPTLTHGRSGCNPLPW